MQIVQLLTSFREDSSRIPESADKKAISFLSTSVVSFQIGVSQMLPKKDSLQIVQLLTSFSEDTFRIAELVDRQAICFLSTSVVSFQIVVSKTRPKKDSLQIVQLLTSLSEDSFRIAEIADRQAICFLSTAVVSFRIPYLSPNSLADRYWLVSTQVKDSCALSAKQLKQKKDSEFCSETRLKIVTTSFEIAINQKKDMFFIFCKGLLIKIHFCNYYSLIKASKRHYKSTSIQFNQEGSVSFSDFFCFFVYSHDIGP